MAFLEIEVEENANTYGLPLRVYSTKAEPYPIAQVRADTPAGSGVLHWIVGWSSRDGGSPCPAYCVPVEDSGAAVSYLVYGGEWGVRMRPTAVDEPWDVASGRQYGEPYLLLADEADVVRAEKTGG